MRANGTSRGHSPSSLHLYSLVRVCRPLTNTIIPRLLRDPAEYLTSLREAVFEVIGVKDPKFLSSGEVHITLTGG